MWAIGCALSASAALGDTALPPAPTAAPPTSRPARRRVVAPHASQVRPAGDPIPGVAAQQQIENKIREIYATDYADQSFAGRRALARRLIDASEETKRDSAAKYVFLREARDVATAIGDVTTAFDAIDAMAAAFPLVRLHERMDALRKSSPLFNTPQAHLAAVSICMDLVDQCVIDGEYDRADSLLNLAAESARKARSVPHFNWTQSRATSIRPLRDAYDIARPAEAALARVPNDRDANLVMGKFVTFVKGDFDTGLIMLSKSSDTELATLADLDLDTPPEKPSLQLKTGNAWWELSARQPVDYRASMRRRAGFWYRRAAPALDGLDRALAERRLLELNPPPKPGDKRNVLRPPDALKLMTKPDRWYRASIAEVTWETAHRLCAESGGQLICIETRIEGEMMTKLARDRALWLGGSVDATGRWTWLSGADFFFSNWISGEPSNLTPDSHPVTGPNGSWRTFTGRAGFICEWSE